MIPRSRERFTPAERVVLDALAKGERTLSDLVEEYCAGRADGGPITAEDCIRQIIYTLRRKGVVITRHAVYCLEGITDA